jgi:hypothetical protein
MQTNAKITDDRKDKTQGVEKGLQALRGIVLTRMGKKFSVNIRPEMNAC